MTALHWAAYYNNIAVAAALLEKGADANAPDLVGRTPLYFALRWQSIKMTKLLLFYQAEPWSNEGYNFKELVKNSPILEDILNKARKVN